jgi:ribonuclease D
VRDRPRGWIVADAALVEIARAAPADRAALQRVAQMAPAVADQHGEELLEIVRTTPSLSREAIWPPMRPSTSAEQNLSRRWLDRINAIAAEHGIRAEVIATRRAIFSLMRDGAGPLARGWRYEIAGRELLARRGEEGAAR